MRLSRADVLTGAAGVGASLVLGAVFYIAVTVHDATLHAPVAGPLPPAASRTSAPPAVSHLGRASTTPSPSAPPVSLSPVLAQRVTPSIVVVPDGSGTGSAGTMGGSSGNGGGSQPSQAPSPAPSSPRPSPAPTTSPKPHCVVPAGLAICAAVRIGGLGG